MELEEGTEEWEVPSTTCANEVVIIARKHITRRRKVVVVVVVVAVVVVAVVVVVSILDLAVRIIIPTFLVFVLVLNPLIINAQIRYAMVNAFKEEVVNKTNVPQKNENTNV